MRQLAMILLAGVLAGVAWAQLPMHSPPLGSHGGATCASPTYTGPGDVVASAQGWWGIRAYAKATVCTKAINIALNGTSTNTDINTLASGFLDIATANSFAGTDATCTASASGTTTLSVSSCSSGTLHLYDVISGAGIVNPSFITAIGTCGTPAGTCTLNAAQNFSSTTITAQTALAVGKIYDQSGAKLCPVSTPCDATTSSAWTIGQNAFALIPNVLGTLPALYQPSQSTSPLITPTFSSLPSQPFTVSSVAERTSQLTSYGFVMGSGGTNNGVGYHSSNQTIYFFASEVATTASDNAVHAFQWTVNGASSIVNVDGTETTLNPGAGVFSTNVRLSANSSGNELFGYQWEWGLWSGQFTGTQRTNVCQNQQSTTNGWGTTHFPANC